MQDLCPTLCVGMMLGWGGVVSHPPTWEWVSSFLPSYLHVPWWFAASRILFLLTGAPEPLLKAVCQALGSSCP